MKASDLNLSDGAIKLLEELGFKYVEDETSDDYFRKMTNIVVAKYSKLACLDVEYEEKYGLFHQMLTDKETNDMQYSEEILDALADKWN